MGCQKGRRRQGGLAENCFQVLYVRNTYILVFRSLDNIPHDLLGDLQLRNLFEQLLPFPLVFLCSLEICGGCQSSPTVDAIVTLGSSTSTSALGSLLTSSSAGPSLHLSVISEHRLGRLTYLLKPFRHPRYQL